MYIKRNVCPSIIFYFSWQTLLFTGLLSATVFALYNWGYHKIAIPFLPVATVGTAVAFYVGFKNNSSYDRLWEARKIWGEIINLSRSTASYLLAVAREPHSECNKDTITTFIYRQIAYVNMVRLQLRRRNVWDESHLYTYLAANCSSSKSFAEDAEDCLRELCAKEADSLLSAQNIAKELLHKQMQALTKLKNAGVIDGFEHSDLMRLCSDMFAQQGKAERIKNSPFPRQYAYFSEVFVSIFICLLPFGLIGEFAKLNADFIWLTIPFSMLISWIFDTMEKVGDTSENPFENGIHDVPMTAICRAIEIDLRELLGESELPEPLQAIDHILM